MHTAFLSLGPRQPHRSCFTTLTPLSVFNVFALLLTTKKLYNTKLRLDAQHPKTFLLHTRYLHPYYIICGEFWAFCLSPTRHNLGL
ncbi:hypothetical protein BU25DRAFT_50687 [Macroventuria anomochaeta]|uniref:Uncharacterized protein n=1 Tax=Macroventuria anomochaeta TaxID=301207 RepID=A0ACB6S0C6_9PLEO|nr:uncharacterized protein BU25DRAFT_50687 [Macroventuria anomochaeta]KAF2627596.1 hypothetical protein BU25DRAFT_50687 [Macroventuria anomochaeta]